GRVERAIQYIRHSFFAARSFTGPADLNRQVRIWRDEIAHQRPWPGDDSRTVIDAFTQEKPRLLPLPRNAFDTGLTKPVPSDKAINIRFNQIDYPPPPDAVPKHLTLVPTREVVRLLDGLTKIARHRRSYDRHARIEDPSHIQALVEDKRRALGATAPGRLGAAIARIDRKSTRLNSSH